MPPPGVPKGLVFERLSLGPGKKLVLRARTAGRSSPCPLCGANSRRVHSAYERTVSDLPWHDVAVGIVVRARRFFCDVASCERRIFCERLPDVAARARKTNRLEEALLAITLKLGGRAGARLAEELGLLVGRDALLSRAKRAAPAYSEKVRVPGVDDFASRRGDAYGTILVDLERRRVVDLLPERSQESLSAWLERHPGVEVATRDRSRIYREGMAKGAPDATRRWPTVGTSSVASPSGWRSSCCANGPRWGRSPRRKRAQRAGGYPAPSGAKFRTCPSA